MPQDLDAVRRNFEDLDTQALIDEYLHHPQDYTPEAWSLLEAELHNRGFSKDKLTHLYGETVLPAAEHDKLVEIQTLHNPIAAVELQEYLEERGIPCYFSGEIFLHVHEDHADRAAHLIEEYFEEPADEELDSDED